MENREKSRRPEKMRTRRSRSNSLGFAGARNGRSSLLGCGGADDIGAQACSVVLAVALDCAAQGHWDEETCEKTIENVMLGWDCAAQASPDEETCGKTIRKRDARLATRSHGYGRVHLSIHILFWSVFRPLAVRLGSRFLCVCIRMDVFEAARLGAAVALETSFVNMGM